MPGQKVAGEGQKKQTSHHSQNSHQTVKKELIRQKIDNGIGVRIEQPVIVAEQNMVERGEKPLPVDNGQDAGQSGNDRCDHWRQQKKTTVFVPSKLVKSKREEADGRQDQKDLEPIEDPFDLFEVNPPFLGHRKRWEVKLSPEKQAVVIDQRIVIGTYFLLGHLIAFRQIHRRHVMIVDGTEIQNENHTEGKDKTESQNRKKKVDWRKNPLRISSTHKETSCCQSL